MKRNALFTKSGDNPNFFTTLAASIVEVYGESKGRYYIASPANQKDMKLLGRHRRFPLVVRLFEPNGEHDFYRLQQGDRIVAKVARRAPFLINGWYCLSAKFVKKTHINSENDLETMAQDQDASA